MVKNKIALKNLDTYVYIDVSNIRWACKKTLNWHIDFAKLLDYLRTKYPNLKEARYYEGIARGDTTKQRTFNFLSKLGYIICPLERKAYSSTEVEQRAMECPRCSYQWVAQHTKTHKALKSNVDVYLATEFLTVAHSAKKPVHLILVACDGDYAEMLKNAVSGNTNVNVSVLATPTARDLYKNTMSIRLKQLYNILPGERFRIINIHDLEPHISS